MNEKIFVIVCNNNGANERYYMTKYIVQGEYYPAFTGKLEKAKKYKTKKQAERGLEKIEENISYGFDLKIEEVMLSE